MWPTPVPCSALAICSCSAPCTWQTTGGPVHLFSFKIPHLLSCLQATAEMLHPQQAGIASQGWQREGLLKKGQTRPDVFRGPCSHLKLPPLKATRQMAPLCCHGTWPLPFEMLPFHGLCKSTPLVLGATPVRPFPYQVHLASQPQW